MPSQFASLHGLHIHYLRQQSNLQNQARLKLLKQREEHLDVSFLNYNVELLHKTGYP